MTGHKITDKTTVNEKTALINPFRYRSYYFDVETGLYYLQSRYYDPEVGRFISMDAVEYLDSETINGFNLYAYCGNDPVMGYDPNGTWDWGKFWKGVGLVATAVTAVAVSVVTFGAGTPVAMTVVAGVTLASGVLTGVNGIATMVEAGTDYNFVRDGLFNEVLRVDDQVYDAYESVVEKVAIIGTLICGGYQQTGRFKASKYGRKYLGKGYKNAGKGRWVSKDGLRQMRLDKSRHMYHGKPSRTHFNFETWRYPIDSGVKHNKARNKIHQFFNLFKTWVE